MYMKILRYNESSSIPLYIKGQILVYVHDDIRFNTALDISKKIGYPIQKPKKGSFFESENCFIVNTPFGKEDIVGSLFVEDYPEFFSSYSRRDMNIEDMITKIDNIESLVGGLTDFIEVRKVDDGINTYIDNIIDELKKLKI